MDRKIPVLFRGWTVDLEKVDLKMWAFSDDI